MEAARKTSLSYTRRGGSALILTVVLTSLLAIVGVLFLMISRVDRVATSAVSENRQLDLAVDAVVETICHHLIWDVPGTSVPGWGRPEYHDYPGPQDPWLASSEPYQAGPDYFWRHISDIYGKFAPAAVDFQVAVVPEYQPSIAEGLMADADGDGIADSIWVVMPDITSRKGGPIFVAVRIIDNGGMINMNTAYKFDPCDPAVMDPCNPDIS